MSEKQAVAIDMPADDVPAAVAVAVAVVDYGRVQFVMAWIPCVVSCNLIGACVGALLFSDDNSANLGIKQMAVAGIIGGGIFGAVTTILAMWAVYGPKEKECARAIVTGIVGVLAVLGCATWTGAAIVGNGMDVALAGAASMLGIATILGVIASVAACYGIVKVCITDVL